MMASLRTYRLIASILSVLLLLSVTLPLVLQVCCAEPMSQSTASPCHDDMAREMQDMPDDALQTHMNHSATGLQDDCCVIQSAQTPISESRLLAEMPRLVLPPMLWAATYLLPLTRPASPPLVLAASPPAPPLSLHLLNGSFLN